VRVVAFFAGSVFFFFFFFGLFGWGLLFGVFFYRAFSLVLFPLTPLSCRVH